VWQWRAVRFVASRARLFRRYDLSLTVSLRSDLIRQFGQPIDSSWLEPNLWRMRLGVDSSSNAVAVSDVVPPYSFFFPRRYPFCLVGWFFRQLDRYLTSRVGAGRHDVRCSSPIKDSISGLGGLFSCQPTAMF